MNASVLLISMASLSAGAGPQDVLYDFYGPNCIYCQMMAPIVERLREEGFPVQTVDATQYPDFASQFAVTQWPTFILVIGGRMQQRLVGRQDESTLRAMLAQIPRRQAQELRPNDSGSVPRPRRSLPVRLAGEDTKSDWSFHLPLPSFSRKSKDQVVQIDPPRDTSAAPNQGGDGRADTKAALADASAPVSGASQAPSDSPGADNSPERNENIRKRSVGAQALASSVRIRVKDSAGAYYGSGVAIGSEPGKTLILTCGHILRDAKTGSRIEVDVFDGNRSRTYRGTIVKCNLDADVGLISIATPNTVPVSVIASAGDAVRTGDAAVCIGCSGGELPSVERLRVTALNRYQGPDTIECTHVPAEGRSGGGLFLLNGHVVGVCTNADPGEKRGVYAGLRPIHELLHSAGLDELIPAGPKTQPDSLAAASVSTEQVASNDAAAPPTRPSKPQQDGDAVNRSPVGHSASGEGLAVAAAKDPAVAPTAAIATGSNTAEEEVVSKSLEQAEVICIIRPINQPQSASRVVIINRASRKFMAYLNGERVPGSKFGGEKKDQLVPAMGRTTADDSPVDRSSHVAARDLSRTTAAWKPTGTRN